MIEPYFKALESEIESYSSKLKEFEVETVFIGGGTPSSVEAEYIVKVINTLKNSYNIKENAEISMETNPGTLSQQKLNLYKKIGINRLSIGLQAWQNNLLKSIGRIHSIDEFVDNFNMARKIGFDNINVDLIFSLPGQTKVDWVETLKNVANLSPEHISCYSLKIEEGTIFGEKLKSGQINETEDELDREMYYYAIETLGKYGYDLYEISNFSKPGKECRHNLIYWNINEYLGFGSGAHSYFKGNRFNNTCDLHDYINKLSHEISAAGSVISIDKEESMVEYIILGLRLSKGICSIEFESKYGMSLYQKFGDKFKNLNKNGLVYFDNSSIKLTNKGRDLANQVFIEFI